MDDKTEVYRGGSETDRAFLVSFLGDRGIPCSDTKLSLWRGPGSLYVHPDHAAKARQLIREFDRTHGGKVTSPEQYRSFQRTFVFSLIIGFLAIALLMHHAHIF